MSQVRPSNVSENTDTDARGEGFFITKIVNTKRHVNFKLLKLSLQLEGDNLFRNDF